MSIYIQIDKFTHAPLYGIILHLLARFVLKLRDWVGFLFEGLKGQDPLYRMGAVQMSASGLQGFSPPRLESFFWDIL